MKNNSFVSQESVNDCGIACTLMILKEFGINLSYGELKSKFKVNNEGVSAYEIIKVAKSYGVSGVGYKNYLINEKTCFPFIAHLIINEKQHFVVVIKKIKDKLLVKDPAKGIYEISINDFEEMYSKIAIVFKKCEYKLKFNYKKSSILLFVFLITSLFNIGYVYVLSSMLNKNVYIMSYVLFLFVFGVLYNFSSFLKDRILINLRLKTDKLITIPTLNKLYHLPYKYYKKTGSGNLLSKINDLSYVKDMINALNEVVLINVVILIVCLVIIFFISPYIFLFNLLILFISHFISRKFYLKNNYYVYSLQSKNEVFSGEVVDFLNNILTIKSLNKADYFYNKNKESYLSNIKLYKKIALSYQTKDFVIGILNLFLTLSSFILYILLEFPFSNIIFIIYIQNIIQDSTREILNLQGINQNYKASKKRLDKLFELKTENYNNEALDIKNISIRNLTYGYKEDINILNNINLDINKGDFAIITGKTGIGKSTLFKLVTKELNPLNNMIYINDIDINNYDTNLINSSITYVNQQSKLFNLSIEENIYLGSNSKLRKRVLKVIDDEFKRANIKLEDKVDSKNSNLSGGQIELIMIARSLVNSSSVIIFDETTNQLDSLLERRLLKAIKKDYKEKTFIFITHKDTNLDMYDKKIKLFNNKMEVLNENIK